MLGSSMMWSNHVIVTTAKWRAMCVVVACCSFVAGIALTLAAFIYMRKRKEEKIITILDSPPPTRSSKLMTTESHKRMAQSFRARRRGGRRRHGEHRRSVTRVYDPPTANDCGFACILKAAKRACTKVNITELRRKTAARVVEAYVNDENYGSMRAREVVQASDLTLDAYRAQLERDMWASPLEILIAAELLDLHIVIMAEHESIQHGGKPSFLVKLSKHHWTLHALRKCVKVKGMIRCERGGMQSQPTAPTPKGAQHQPMAASVATTRSVATWSTAVPAPVPQPAAASMAARPMTTWTWEHSAPNTVSILSLPPAVPQLEVREEVPEWAIPINAPPGLLPQERDAKVVKVQVCPTLRTDVSALALVVRVTMLPEGLRHRLAEILLLPVERFKLLNVVGEPLPEDTGIPDEVQVRDTWHKYTSVHDILDVSIAGQDQASFILKIDQTWTHGQIAHRIAKILDKPKETIELLDLTGRHGTTQKIDLGPVQYWSDAYHLR